MLARALRRPLALSAALSLMAPPHVASCAGGAGEPTLWDRAAAAAAEARAELERAAEKRGGVDVELAEELGIGLVAGFCSGYALKKLSRAAAVTAGVVFVTAQLAAHSDIITVDRKRVRDLARSALEWAGWDRAASSGQAERISGGHMDVLAWPIEKQGAFGVGVLWGLVRG